MKTNESSLKSMDEIVTDIKIWRKLKGIVCQYLHEKDLRNFQASLSWDETVDILPSIGTTTEMMKLRRAEGETNLTSSLKRNEKGKASPALALRLDSLYCSQFGGMRKSRSKPYRVFLSSNLMKTIQPAIFQEENLVAPLAIIDFSREDQRMWTDSEVYVLLEYILDLSKTTMVVIVMTVHPGQLATNIFLALKRMVMERKTFVQTEYGSYFRAE